MMFPPVRRALGPAFTFLAARFLGFAFIIFFSLPQMLWAQDQNEAGAPYQIPPTLYIGDYGKLIYPLDSVFFNQDNEVIPLDTVRQDAEVVIHRIELNRGKLIIDFQPFRTGRVQLPPFTVAGKTLEGIEVQVTSLISGKDSAILSPAALPLNAPGTLWIITAIAFSIIVAAGIVFMALLRGGGFFFRLRQKLGKRRALRRLMRTVKKHKLSWEKGDTDTAALLSLLSASLRLFLEEYCLVRCVSLVPAEFLHLTFPEGSLPHEKYSPAYFAGFFTRCDTVRFSGAQIRAETVSGIIAEVEAFAASAKQ